MRINANIMALNTQRQLFNTNNAQSKSMEKLSSGQRINRAADDAAGLAISEKMRSQMRGLKQASRNAQDGISVVQTAEGALDEVHAMLQRMKELAVQAANDSNRNEVDREAIQEEIKALLTEIDSIATKTQFNKTNLLDGKYSKKIFQVGANKGQFLSITISAMDKTGLCLQKMCMTSQKLAASAISQVQNAIEKLAKRRAKLGAIQNRLEHTIKNLDNSYENTTAAESRIRHANMAEEIIESTRANILNQAATAMLSQANQVPQSVLTLLR